MTHGAERVNDKTAAEAAGDERGVRTIAEAAAALRCGRDKIYRLEKAGRLEFVKFDRRTLVTERSLQRLLDEIFTSPVLNQDQDQDKS
jgi:excisionase family DNA binding protein